VEETMIRFSGLAILLFFSLFLLSVSASSQENSPDAHLIGTLTDATGAGVAGVHVVAQLENNPQANLWKATSTTAGIFSLTLPSGRYRITFPRPSFVARDAIQMLSPGETRRLDLRLELESLSSSVVVTAQAEPLQVQQTTAPVTAVTRDEMDQRKSIT